MTKRYEGSIFHEEGFYYHLGSGKRTNVLRTTIYERYPDGDELYLLFMEKLTRTVSIENPCEKAFNEGFDTGYDNGYWEGYDAGLVKYHEEG